MTWSTCFAGYDFENRRDTMFVITSGEKKKKEYLKKSERKGKRCHC